MVAGLLFWVMNGIDLIGVGIICYGVARSCWLFLHSLLYQIPISIDGLRLELGRTIVLAVEFLLAADIIKTIQTPDYYEIGMLEPW